MKKRLNILYVLNKTTLTTESKSTVLHNLFLLNIYIFKELPINNNPVKKATRFFVFMEGFQLPHDQVLSKLYCNKKYTLNSTF